MKWLAVIGHGITLAMVAVLVHGEAYAGSNGELNERVSAKNPATQSSITTPRSTTSAYQDRLIEAGSLSPQTDSDEQVTVVNPEGWPRSILIEANSALISNGRNTTSDFGVTLNAQIETPQYGALSLDYLSRTPSGGGIYTIWQRRLPFDNGWFANNALGTLNTLALDGSRNQYRFFLPTFSIEGLATEWKNSRGDQYQLSLGDVGQFGGLQIADFSRQPGKIASAGAQWNVTPQWTLGTQIIDASNIANFLQTSTSANPNQLINARSAYALLAWDHQATRTQANILQSQVSGINPTQGAWIDRSIRAGEWETYYGAFYLDPGLTWGSSTVVDNLRGGYYRLGYRSRQWFWDASVEGVSRIQGDGGSGYYATGSTRYQIDRRLGVGGGLSVRRFDGDAWSSFMYVDHTRGQGNNRLQLDLSNSNNIQQKQITLDQTWPEMLGLQVFTTFMTGIQSDPTHARRLSSAALSLTGDLSSRTFFNSNLSVSSDQDSTAKTAVNVNLGVTWRINARWSLSTNYYDNMGVGVTNPTIDPLAGTTSTVSSTRNRSLYSSLRYQEQAGTASIPLGGVAGGPSGTISGYIFLDANDNGRRDAGELGAPNVTVVLDGKFTTRSDAQGRYTFAAVAPGHHRLTVWPDNLALPWMLDRDKKIEVIVQTREATMTDIGATKPQ